MEGCSKVTAKTIDKPRFDHSVSWFWPLAYAIEVEEAGLDVFAENMTAVGEMEKNQAPPRHCQKNLA
jgi:hypothetical protein